MQHLKLLGGVSAHEVLDSTGTAWVLVEPVSEVENNALNYHPQIVLLVMFSDLLHRVFGLGDLEGLGVGLGLGGLTGGGSGGSSRGSASLLNSNSTGARATVGPLDGQFARSRGIEVKRDLSQTLGGGTGSGAREGLLEEVVAGRVTGNTAVDDTAEQRGTTKTVGTVDTTGQLTTGVETVEGLLVLVEDLCLVVDLNATHGEVENGLHEGNVEVVVDVNGQVVEELLAPRVLLLAISNGVVGLEGLLEVLGLAANLLGELLTGHLAHESTARVVTGVEIKSLGGLGVEDKTDGELVLVLLLPHHTRDVVTVAKLVAESVTIGVEKETTLTTESLSGEELPLGSRVLGVDETSRVDLDLVHVNAVTANGHDHLLAITSGVGAVGSGKAHSVGTVLLEQRSVAKVGSVTTSGQDDGAIDRGRLAVSLVGDTGNLVALLVQAGNAGLLDNRDSVGLVLGQLLNALHESICDGHTRELGIVATVGSGLGVATEEMLASVHKEHGRSSLLIQICFRAAWVAKMMR